MVILMEFTFFKRSYGEFDIIHFGYFWVFSQLLAICCYEQRAKQAFIPQFTS